MSFLNDSISEAAKTEEILEKRRVILRARLAASDAVVDPDPVIIPSVVQAGESGEPMPEAVPSVPAEPEIELVIPEVVEGKMKAKKTRKKAPKKPGAGMAAIDVEVIEPKKEPLVPELEPAEGRPKANEAEKIPGEEKIIDVDFKEVKSKTEQEPPMPERSEIDKKIVELGQRLDDARKFYIEQDREMDKGSSVWKKIFGFGKRLESGTLKQAFDEADARYNNALRDYKDAILATEVQDEEDIKIVTEWLTMKEGVILDGERTDQSAKDKGLSQKVMEYYVSGINKYRKLPWKQRVAVGFGISAVGFGVGMTGGIIGGAAIGGAAGISRILSASALMVGNKEMLEGRAKKKREKKGEEEAKTIIKNSHIEGIGRWEKGAWNDNLNNMISGLDEEIQKNKFDGKLRTWGAVGSGIALSFISRWVGREAMEHLHIKELAQNIGGKLGLFSGVTAEKMNDIQLGKNHGFGLPNETVSVHHTGDRIFANGELAGEQDVIEAKEVAPLIVKPGSSLEGTISQHLKEQGMTPDEAGKKAHLMALEFLNNNQNATEHHLIHPDAKIVLDASGEKILSVDDSSRITMASSGENVTEPDYEKLVEHPENQPSVEMEEVVSPSAPEAESVTPSLVDSGDFLDENASALLENTNASLAEWQDASRETLGSDKYLTLGANFTKSLAKLISGNNFSDWMAVKESSMRELLKREAVSGKRLDALLDRLLKAELPGRDTESIIKFREIMKPNRQESVSSWTKRITILVKHLKINKI